LNTVFQSDNGRSPFGVPDNNRTLSLNFVTVKYACGLPETFDIYVHFFFVQVIILRLSPIYNPGSHFPRVTFGASSKVREWWWRGAHGVYSAS